MNGMKEQEKFWMVDVEISCKKKIKSVEEVESKLYFADVNITGYKLLRSNKSKYGIKKKLFIC